MSFKELNLRNKYKSPKHDLIEEFFNPVLSKSIRYDRSVGFFSSSALIAYIKGIRELVLNGGKMRLIISPILTPNDFQILINKNATPELTKKMFEDFMIKEMSFTSSQLLFMLLEKGIIEIKVSEPINEKGLHHEKVGIFFDDYGNKIAINGSNNETWTALKYNYESFVVMRSWSDNVGYVKEHEDDFNSYWNNEEEHVRFIDLKEVLEGDFIKGFKTDETIDDLYKKLDLEYDDSSTIDFEPWPNQLEAANSWLNNKEGILEMATGTGKTKTAIYIHEKLKKQIYKLFTIVIVPDITLLNQWYDEIKDYNDKIIKVYSGNNKWNKELRNEIEIYNHTDKRKMLIIVTKQTFFTERFLKLYEAIKENIFLLVDEVHNLGTLRSLKLLPYAKYRLGLSATPHIHSSEQLTKDLFNYFGGIVYSYTLDDALRDGILVPYYYHPIIVKLTENEKNRYKQITHQMIKMFGYDEINEKTGNNENNPKLEQMLFKRSRIIYGAKNKMTVLNQIIEDIERKGRLIVYSGITSEKEIKANYYGSKNVETSSKKNEDDVFLKQIDQVGKIMYYKDIKFARYTSNENEMERIKSIEAFENETYSTLLAIKCLDEGVNIPSIERAIILSSSSNPREFVQRRGRILRKNSKTDKKFSEIYDFIVLEENNYEYNFNSLNKKELDRFHEFGRLAINKEELLNREIKLRDKYIMEVYNNG